jgi:hypothetical protein
MDGERFDTWTAELVTPRRGALRLLAGAALAALPPLARATAAAAACAKSGARCKSNGQCCDGVCRKNGQCARNGKLTGKCLCCAPRCAGKQCGDDGCGVACGECSAETECRDGRCVPRACVPDGHGCGLGTCCSGYCCNGRSGPVCFTPGEDVCARQGRECGPTLDYCGAGHDCGNCDDGDPCTVGTCDETTGTCHFAPVPGCCRTDADCPGNACNAGVCVDNACTLQPLSDDTHCGSAGFQRRCCRGVCCEAGYGCAAGQCVLEGGCFVSGTRVAMADGTAKPIELVEPGDAVLGRDGRANRVLDLFRPLLGDRPLHALNGGPAFVTAGHPFLTEAGWKAVDPAAAREEVPGLPVGRLAVGDRLLALAAAVPVAAGGPAHAERAAAGREAVALRSVEARRAEPATPLYNLCVDGDHTYFADGWLVHNKLY